MRNENELYANVLVDWHLQGFIYRLRRIPADKWEYQPALPAPSARILAEHAWQWLVCDRQHIAEPDAARHPRIPDPPADQQAMCDVLEAEAHAWRRLVLDMTPEQLAAPRRQFGQGDDLNVRWFIGHMLNNVIYKHGQLATIYFALGLDGDEPYSAPFPNPIYAEFFGTAG